MINVIGQERQVSTVNYGLIVESEEESNVKRFMVGGDKRWYILFIGF